MLTATAPGRSESSSVPDGAGGAYFAWSDDRDGLADIYLLRVTNIGTPAAGWPADGLAVTTAAGTQSIYAIVSDGTSGVIIVWSEQSGGAFELDYRAQRVSAAATLLWPTNGVKFAGGQLTNLSVASDGTGGLVATWTANGAGADPDIFAIRIASAGSIASGWNSSGTVVCLSDGPQSNPTVIADGSGGAYVAWLDLRQGSNLYHVYCQRMNGSGAAQWTANGLQVDASSNGVWIPSACSDATGGVMVFWEDATGPSYGQRLNSTGAAQWAAGGIDISGGTSIGTAIGAVVDDLGGAITTWILAGLGPTEIRAQRVNSAGAKQWGTSGALIVQATESSYPNVTGMTGDGAGGGYFVWEDDRAGLFNLDVYAQRVSAAGVIQWGANGKAVCNSGPWPQLAPAVVPDGTGGTLISWLDLRDFQSDVYAQRFSAAGVTQFPANGLGVYVNPGLQKGSVTIPDGGGGAFVVWNEKRSGNWDVMARKFLSDGSPSAPAVAVSAAPGNQFLESAIPDGAGGLIIAWTDSRSGNADIYGQRMGASLVPLWTADGVPICTAAGMQMGVRVVTDGAGGGIFSWSDARAVPDQFETYTQLINLFGVPQWTSGGVNVSGSDMLAGCVSDGTGGVIVLWNEDDSGSSVRAQRLNSSGIAQWGSGALVFLPLDHQVVAGVSDGASGVIVLGLFNDYSATTGDLPGALSIQRLSSTGTNLWGGSGVTICNAGASIEAPQIGKDGAGGTFVAWTDGRSHAFDVYIQHVNVSGAAQWANNGVTVCGATGRQMTEGVIADGSGGVIVTWSDERSGFAKVYAQRMNPSGAPIWAVNGQVVTMGPRGQYLSWPSADGTGGAFVTWTDNRPTTHRRVFVQHLNASGNPQWPLEGVAHAPNPTGSSAGAMLVVSPATNGNIVALIAAPSGQAVRVELFDAGGRVVATRTVVGQGSPVSIHFGGERLATGLYFVRANFDRPASAKVVVLR